MQPIRPIGETIAVTSGSTAAVAKASSQVWVTNQGTTWAEFSAQSGASGTTPDAGGIPIPPNQGLVVGIPHNATFYAAAGGALSVTPVELQKSQ